MKRREVIKGLGLSFGAMLLTPSAMSLLHSCTKETGPIWEPVFFSKNQVQFLNKITDIIFSPEIYIPILAFFSLVLITIFLRKSFYKN